LEEDKRKLKDQVFELKGEHLALQIEMDELRDQVLILRSGEQGRHEELTSINQALDRELADLKLKTVESDGGTEKNALDQENQALFDKTQALMTKKTP